MDDQTTPVADDVQEETVEAPVEEVATDDAAADVTEAPEEGEEEVAGDDAEGEEEAAV